MDENEWRCMQSAVQAEAESCILENYPLVRLGGEVNISVERSVTQGWIMWSRLYPHGVTVAWRVSDSVPTLQKISCLDKHANFRRRGEKTPGVLCEISPRRAGLQFFHLLQIQDRPTLPKQPGRTHVTEETLAWFQRLSLFQITQQKHVQFEVAEEKQRAGHTCM